MALMALMSCSSSSNEVDISINKASKIYIATQQSIYTINLSSPDELLTVVAPNEIPIATIMGLAVDKVNEKIFFTTLNAPYIFSKNLDGTGPVIELGNNQDGLEAPTALCVNKSGTTLFWINKSMISKGSVNGTNVSNYYIDQISESSYGLSLLKGENQFVVSDVSTGLFVGNTNGSGNLHQLYPAEITEQVLGVDVNRITNEIYWVSADGNQIIKGTLNGGNHTILFDSSDGLSYPNFIAIDEVAEKIYWTEFDGVNSILKVGNLDGSGAPEMLLDNIPGYGHIALDN